MSRKSQVLTGWREIAGYKCVECGEPASHFYDGKAFCCKCHGGNYFSPEDVKFAHEMVAKEKRIVNKYED